MGAKAAQNRGFSGQKSSGKTSKRKRADSVSSAESSDRISVNDAASNASDIDVEFEFLDVSEADFHGVSLLVNRLMPSAFDFTSLTECIVDQQNIGVKVVTDSEDGSVCAFGTLLNLRQYSPAVQGFTQLLEYIRKHTPAEAQTFLDPKTGNRGLFLGERIINVPPSVGPQMHGVVVEDARWSLSPEAACPPEEIGFYDFQEVLVYSVFLVDPAEASGAAVTGKKKKKKNRKEDVSSRIYLHAEDEVLVEVAKRQWSWAEGEHDDGEKFYKKHRLCYVVDWKIYVEQVARLVEAFAN